MSVDGIKNEFEEPIASEEQLALCREFQRAVVVKLREFVRDDPGLAEIFYCGRPKSKVARAKPVRLGFMARHVFTPGKTGTGGRHCRPNEMIVEAKMPDLERKPKEVFAVSEEHLVEVRYLMGMGLVGRIAEDPSLAYQLDFFRDLSRESVRSVVCSGRSEEIAATVARAAQMVVGCINSLNREQVFDYE